MKQKSKKPVYAKKPGKFFESKGYKFFLIFTYAVTVPFIGLVLGGTAGWLIGSVAGLAAAFAVWKR